jgi:hypothetical protein
VPESLFANFNCECTSGELPSNCRCGGRTHVIQAWCERGLSGYVLCLHVHTVGVVTPLSSHSPRSENGDVATCPWEAEGPFSENGNPNFFSSFGEEWAILGEEFTPGVPLLTSFTPGGEFAWFPVAVAVAAAAALQSFRWLCMHFWLNVLRPSRPA